MMLLSMNKTMYTMNASEFLFKNHNNMFAQHIESMLDEKLVSSFEPNIEEDGEEYEEDCVKKEIIFGDEQFKNIINNNYNTFEKTPYETEEEWIIIQDENAQNNEYFDNLFHDEDDDDDTIQPDE